MRLDFKDICLTNNFVDVMLPEYLYHPLKQEYLESSPQAKGIIVEVLASLWMRRVFGSRHSRWVASTYSSIDFVVDNHFIDFKSTEQIVYGHLTQEKIEAAKKVVKDTHKEFNFLLLSVNSWIEMNGFGVRLQLHELLTMDGLGHSKKYVLKNANKCFKNLSCGDIIYV